MSSDSERRHRALTTLAMSVPAVAAIALAAAVIGGRGHAARPQIIEPPHRLVVASDEPQPTPGDPSRLRVCADPNNLPFSNDRREGFENAIADLIATSLGRTVEYYWQPQRRGFFRTTLNAGWCDVVMGVPARFELASTTRPYYRSTYVFVSRAQHGRPVRSLDDPALRRLRIGVEITGEDYENPPALQALAARHIIDNVHGYLVYGDYSTPDPPQRVVNAVSRGELDTAIVWGPLAGYFARRSTPPLQLAAVTPERDGPGLQFAFDIAMAVRKRDRALHDELDRALAAHRDEITGILRRFGVPLLAQKGSGT